MVQFRLFGIAWISALPMRPWLHPDIPVHMNILFALPCLVIFPEPWNISSFPLISQVIHLKFYIAFSPVSKSEKKIILFWSWLPYVWLKSESALKHGLLLASPHMSIWIQKPYLPFLDYCSALDLLCLLWQCELLSTQGCHCLVSRYTCWHLSLHLISFWLLAALELGLLFGPAQISSYSVVFGCLTVQLCFKYWELLIILQYAWSFQFSSPGIWIIGRHKT